MYRQIGDVGGESHALNNKAIAELQNGSCPGARQDLEQELVLRWVEEIGQRPGDDDPRRRYYRLSSLGRGVLTAETARLASVVREARLRLQVTKPRRA